MDAVAVKRLLMKSRQTNPKRTIKVRNRLRSGDQQTEYSILGKDRAPKPGDKDRIRTRVVIAGNIMLGNISCTNKLSVYFVMSIWRKSNVSVIGNRHA